MDTYQCFLREVLQLAGEIYFRRVEAELQKFADALNEWLYELFERPRPDWREGLDQLFAQQQAAGRVPTSESHQALLDFLEGWANSVDWNAVNGNDRAVVLPTAALSGDVKRPAPSPKRWPALTNSEAEAAQKSTGLPWWYPIQPRNLTDSAWQERLVAYGHSGRDRLLAFYREVAALGHMSRTNQDPEQFDFDSLLAQQQKVQQRYDGYIQAKLHIYREWTRYLSLGLFVGPKVFRLIRKIDNALPDGVEGFDSPRQAELKAARRASFEATNKKMQRANANYTALKWTDNVITAIEIVTLVGSVKAVFKQTAKKLVRKGLSKAAARRVAAGYVVAHLGVAAASAAVISSVVPQVLIDAGLDEADVRAGLVIFRTAVTIVGLRSIEKPPRPSEKTRDIRVGGSQAIPKRMPKNKVISRRRARLEVGQAFNKAQAAKYPYNELR